MTIQPADSTDFTVSEDGYIRLSLASFLALRFDERIEWQDEDLRMDLGLEKIAAFRAGYCEWACATKLMRVSVGWAWLEESPPGGVVVAPGGISSNVMLVNPHGRDLGARRTESLLRSWLSFLKWCPDQVASSFEEALQLHAASL